MFGTIEHRFGHPEYLGCISGHYVRHDTISSYWYPGGQGKKSNIIASEAYHHAREREGLEQEALVLPHKPRNTHLVGAGG